MKQMLCVYFGGGLGACMFIVYYIASGQAMSLVVNNSLSFTESEIQPGTDVDKEIIEIIPEEGEGGSRTGSGEVLRNPNTSREDEHRP